MNRGVWWPQSLESQRVGRDWARMHAWGLCLGDAQMGWQRLQQRTGRHPGDPQEPALNFTWGHQGAFTEELRSGYWDRYFVVLLIIQLCLTLCDPMDCSPPSSSLHGIFQAIILEWVAIPFSRRSSWPKDQTRVSCIVGRFFTIWVTKEAKEKYVFAKEKNKEGISIKGPACVKAPSSDGSWNVLSPEAVKLCWRAHLKVGRSRRQGQAESWELLLRCWRKRQEWTCEICDLASAWPEVRWPGRGIATVWIFVEYLSVPTLICWLLTPKVGEGNGNPLQYSCLENPMDRGAW